MKKRYASTWESLKEHQVPQWYEDGKFGIFIHWGLYSVPAFAPQTWELGEVPPDETWFSNNPYAEWYYNSIHVGYGPSYDYHVKKYGKDFKYEQFADMWKAEKWNPAEWARLFKKAGAEYVVLTTKHHDGFCLFPSKYTDYNALKRGPQRDIVGDLTDAVRGENLRMGLYYSGIVDWTFADDPILNNDDLFHTASPTFAYADYAYNQSMELIDRFAPSVFWNDIGWPRQGEHNLPYLLSHYYNTVEDGVVNDRFNDLYYDFTTKEYQSGSANRREKWEMCRGMGLSFGYNAMESDDKIISIEDAISLLVSTVANNGNLLLNIGPRADGTIPEEQEKRLLAIGEWLGVNGEAIYGSRCSSRESIKYTDQIQVHFTERDGALYVLIDAKGRSQVSVTVPGLSGNAVPLDPKVEAETAEADGGLRFTVKNFGDSQNVAVFRLNRIM